MFIKASQSVILASLPLRSYRSSHAASTSLSNAASPLPVLSRPLCRPPASTSQPLTARSLRFRPAPAPLASAPFFKRLLRVCWKPLTHLQRRIRPGQKQPLAALWQHRARGQLRTWRSKTRQSSGHGASNNAQGQQTKSVEISAPVCP